MSGRNGAATPVRSGTSQTGELVAAALAGRKAALGRLLSLMERSDDAAREIARLTADRVHGRVHTVGITGVPGAGKSTLVDQLVSRARDHDQRVAVLAVDPSSPYTGGALLGDRARMEGHFTDGSVFIRSIATRGESGGLAGVVPDAVQLLDAVGMATVIVETVGVGQVELDIAGEADTVVVVLNPGWGDWFQASKAGLLEVADVFVVNKADRPGVRETLRDLRRMLDQSAQTAHRPPVLTTVGTTGEGVGELWAEIVAHRRAAEESGRLAQRRSDRKVRWMRRSVTRRIDRMVARLTATAAAAEIERALRAGDVDVHDAADALLDQVMTGLATGADRVGEQRGGQR